ncbi:MAG: hypothetical protein WA705_23285 [Candidatus Ozemobacteraceae bacterium]
MLLNCTGWPTRKNLRRVACLQLLVVVLMLILGGFLRCPSEPCCHHLLDAKGSALNHEENSEEHHFCTALSCSSGAQLISGISRCLLLPEPTESLVTCSLPAPVTVFQEEFFRPPITSRMV